MQGGAASGPRGHTPVFTWRNRNTNSHAFAPPGVWQRYLQQPGREVASCLLRGEWVQKHGPDTVNITRP